MNFSTILKQANVLLWTSFEVLARDLLIEVLNSDQFQEFSIKSIPVETLEKYNFEIRNHLGDIFADQHDWSNLKTIKDSIKSIWPSADLVHKNLKNYNLHKLNQRRHLIVHRKGIVDSQYNSSTKDNFEIGKELPLTPNDLKEDVQTVKTVGCNLLDTYRSKK